MTFCIESIYKLDPNYKNIIQKYQGERYGGDGGHTGSQSTIQTKGVDSRIKVAITKKQDSPPKSTGGKSNPFSAQSTSLTLIQNDTMEVHPLVIILLQLC
jgi:hypothetical protein